MRSVSPVFTEAEVQFEYEIAKNQPEYNSVIGLPVTLQLISKEDGSAKEIPNWAISIRFRLSDEERAQIAAGEDLVVSQLTFGKQLAPMNFQFCKPGEKPSFQTPEEVLPAPAESGPHCATCMRQQAGDDMSGAAHQSGTLEHPSMPTPLAWPKPVPSAEDLDTIAAEQAAADATE